jgi:hypothetical protein
MVVNFMLRIEAEQSNLPTLNLTARPLYAIIYSRKAKEYSLWTSIV